MAKEATSTKVCPIDISDADLILNLYVSTLCLTLAEFISRVFNSEIEVRYGKKSNIN